MGTKFANPQTDFTFKRLFGSDKHKTLTISLLNIILGRQEGNLITQVMFCNTENIPLGPVEKESYLDILCYDQTNTYFIIEMQIAREAHFKQRAVFYTSFKIVDQIHDGDLYSILRPVIFIGILNHILFPDKKAVVSHHAVCNLENLQQSFHEFEYHFVELPKFDKKLDQLETDLDKWLFFLTSVTDLQMIPEPFAGDAQFKEAFDTLEKEKWNNEERRLYQKSVDLLTRDLRLQEGIFEQGAQAEKLVVAIKMLKKNMNIADIADMTGLSVEQIEKLRLNI